MSRETCWRCFWPKEHCWCQTIVPIETETRFVFLMHPMEFKREKANTGRLTHLCLSTSEIHMGVVFDEHELVQNLIHDPENIPMLLWPGAGSRNLSTGGFTSGELQGRRLVVFILDATWACARKMFRESRSLQELPRLMFNTEHTSRYTIKRQPSRECLSTLETCHELLLALTTAGLDHYDDPGQLYRIFDHMQNFQIQCEADPNRPSYRKPQKV